MSRQKKTRTIYMQIKPSGHRGSAGYPRYFALVENSFINVPKGYHFFFTMTRSPLYYGSYRCQRWSAIGIIANVNDTSLCIDNGICLANDKAILKDVSEISGAPTAWTGSWSFPADDMDPTGSSDPSTIACSFVFDPSLVRPTASFAVSPPPSLGTFVGLDANGITAF